MHAHRQRRRDQPGVHERAKPGDGPLRPAARVADATRPADRVGLLGPDLGEAVGPALARAVGGGGVDDPHRVALDQRCALARRTVGQAQDRDVRGVQQAPALLDVLALARIDLEQGQVGAPGEPLADLQARRAGLAVDEYRRGHVREYGRSRTPARARCAGPQSACRASPKRATSAACAENPPRASPSAPVAGASRRYVPSACSSQANVSSRT